MSAAELDTILLVAAVAAACAVPGVFLVLRKLALVGDAISHVLLFGIVLAYFIVADLDSPWLMVGATLSGVLTVVLVEALQKTQLLKEDAAIGLVFPALFAIGTLLASMYFRGTHLDVDAVLLGHAEFVVQAKPIFVWGSYLGRAPTLLMSGMFVINGLLVCLFYKELKICTFDAALAATLGFLPMMVHYGLMTVVSLTTVAAFDAVGPVLVVAFLVVPPGDGVSVGRSAQHDVDSERGNRRRHRDSRRDVGLRFGNEYRRNGGRDAGCVLRTDDVGLAQTRLGRRGDPPLATASPLPRNDADDPFIAT